MRFEFATATKIIFGSGTLKEIGPLAHPFGKRALIVTGRNPQRAEKLIRFLDEAGITSTTFGVAGEPKIDTVRQGLEQARRDKIDLVVGFGGGSALDTGKAIAVMLTNPGDILDYLEVIGGGKLLTHPSVPFIAIPTTSGTGSEVTRNAVLSSPEHRIKVSLRSPHMLPKVALVDPELTLDLPPAITAATGMDALTQLIEPYVCNRANPLSDTFCLQGIPLVARSLLTAYRDGQNLAAREDMALASLLGGLALSNSGLGAVHGLAGVIGGMFDAPHGALCGILLPEVMNANLDASPAPIRARFQTITKSLTGKDEANLDEGIEMIRTWSSQMLLPSLSRYGVKKESLEEIGTQSLRANSMKSNPITPRTQVLTEIMRFVL